MNHRLSQHCQRRPEWKHGPFRPASELGMDSKIYSRFRWRSKSSDRNGSWVIGNDHWSIGHVGSGKRYTAKMATLNQWIWPPQFYRPISTNDNDGRVTAESGQPWPLTKIDICWSSASEFMSVFSNAPLRSLYAAERVREHCPDGWFEFCKYNFGNLRTRMIFKYLIIYLKYLIEERQAFGKSTNSVTHHSTGQWWPLFTTDSEYLTDQFIGYWELRACAYYSWGVQCGNERISSE